MINEPLEEQALRVVIDLLQGMTGVRPFGEPYPNPPRVQRDLPMSTAGIGQCPMLVVTMAVAGSGYALGEDIEGMVSVGGAIGYKNTFAFDVLGYVQGTATAADTWCLRLRRDVLDTLCARAEAIPGVPQARSLWPVGETEFDPGGLGEHVRAFRQAFAVDFDEVMTLG
jgi:hypothetical protein